MGLFRRFRRVSTGAARKSVRDLFGRRPATSVEDDAILTAEMARERPRPTPSRAAPPPPEPIVEPEGAADGAVQVAHRGSGRRSL